MIRKVMEQSAKEEEDRVKSLANEKTQISEERDKINNMTDTKES
jgi:hypothetical protein|tara:strand:- start:170 stop:301 length:132 start_codon:yes stop_codon:yes gene_type:complete